VSVRLFADDVRKLREEAAVTGYPWHLRIRRLVREALQQPTPRRRIVS